jgi:hypothetical protein
MSRNTFAQCVMMRHGPQLREVLSMKPETAGKIKYGVWGLIVSSQ